ncbi:7TM-DISM domain-containing protein [Dyadobacter sp. CY323]|uniref:sensor histidine kinase n=1 Tax=Dyadobacter sp. CY323 TaxID=2907302 RepID=UPI001F45906D|nr:7TM-DISM domain-containing protein [Dyadobacter sp. CY323]MCE6991464.1 histidine kinase [Dyadobacter sp. CY323]
MLKPLLKLIICLSLAAVCCAQKSDPSDISGKANVFTTNDGFSESDLFGYVYAFSTADSNLGVQQILSQRPPFRLIKREIPHFGQDNRYHWIRMDIKNGTPENSQLISYLHLNELTDVCFYIVNEKNQTVYQQEHFSQRTLINKKPIPSRFFAFPVDLPAKAKATIYWRIYRDENSVVAPFRLYSKDSFDSFLRIYDSLAFLCLGVILSAFLLSIILFVITKLKVLFYYAGYCLFYFFLCIINDGIALQYFHIDPFDIAIGARLVATGFMLFFLLQFSKHFLGADNHISIRFIKFTDYLSCILPALALTIAVFSLGAGFVSVFFLLGGLSLLLIFVMMIHGMYHHKRAAYLYFLATAPFFLTCIWFVFIMLFDVPATWLYYTSLLVIPIIEMVVLGTELGNKLIRERDKYFYGLHSLQRELTSSILKTQELERRRIAADLHDDLGGTLATIRLKFASLKKNLYLKGTEQLAMQVVEDIDPLIYKSSHDLRRISQTLMPPEFERIGLAASVQHAVDSLPEQGARFLFLTAGNQRTISPEKELAIYRIASETLQNISRREHVRRGSLQILYCQSELRIVVEADEKIDSTLEAKAIIQKSLSSCSLLATHLGGNLVLEVSRSGTFVIVEVPY